MTTFILEKEEGVWFDFPGGGRVQLRAPSLNDYIRISKASVTNKPFLHEENGKPPRIFNHEIPDVEKQSHLFNDCIILAWEGFFDKNEKEIPCTPENKTLLMRLDDSIFRDFVNEKTEALIEANRIKEETLKKN